MDDLLRVQFIEQAITAHPEEAIAVWVRSIDGTEQLKPIESLIKNGGEDLAISTSDIAEAVGDGELLALVHSHTNGQPEASMVDKLSCERMGVPWHILCLPQQTWEVYSPSGYIPPLDGRDWSYPVMDCYALIRDAYRQLGIILKDYPRDPLYYKNEAGKQRYCWHQAGWRKFEEYFEDAGFVEVNDPRPYDLLIMQMRCVNRNHAGLLLRGGEVLHHVLGQKSRKQLWDGDLRQSTTLILRHSLLSETVALTRDLQLY
jgi:proteasome lid subunit RPN8/RPN11